MTKLYGIGPALLAAMLCGNGCSSNVDAPTDPEVTGTTRQPIVTDHVWTRGMPKQTLIPASQGFCYITSISGDFDARAQRVSLGVENGAWTLDGADGRSDPFQQTTIHVGCANFVDFTSTPQAARVSENVHAWARLDCLWNGGFGCDDHEIGDTSQPLWDLRSLCYLTGMAGMFNGGGESIAVKHSGTPPSLEVQAGDDKTFEDTEADARCVWFGQSANLSHVTEHVLVAGGSPVDLMDASRGICMITGVTGRFRGTGEAVTIARDPSTNHWIQSARSGQIDVAFTAACIPFDQGLFAEPPPPPPPPVPSCSATTACGNEVDVGCAIIAAPLSFQRLGPSGWSVLDNRPASSSNGFFVDRTAAGPSASYRVCTPANQCTQLDVTLNPQPCQPPPPPPPPCGAGKRWCGDSVGCLPLKMPCQ